MPTSPWRSIAVVVDPFEKSHPALQKAAALARRCGANLTLLNTFVLPQPMADVAGISARELIAAALRDRRRMLEKEAAALRRRKGGRALRVRCVVEWDHPQHEAVVRHVMDAKPDLLVAEGGHHGRLARWILSNTDWELIRSCPCPLWLVRGASLPARPKLLVAVDPRHVQARRSRLDTRLMEAAHRLTGNFGGTISVVHADDPDDSCIDAVERLAARHAVPPARRYVIPGPTTRVLPEVVAKSGADVLLLGAVSRSRPGEPFIGTTAERIIDRVECDLFVVKPVGYRSPVSKMRSRLPG
ncbi:MAG: universal stress protein [Gammaproteobacteria bacterium]